MKERVGALSRDGPSNPGKDAHETENVLFHDLILT